MRLIILINYSRKTVIFRNISNTHVKLISLKYYVVSNQSDNFSKNIPASTNTYFLICSSYLSPNECALFVYLLMLNSFQKWGQHKIPSHETFVSTSSNSLKKNSSRTNYITYKNMPYKLFRNLFYYAR